jgi:cell division protease FtsH
MLADPNGPAHGPAHGQVPDESSNQPRTSWWRHPLLWLLLGLVIIFWVLPMFNISLFGTTPSRAAITYSTFVTQVTANNVKSVTITDYSVTGVAKTAITSQDGKVHSTQFTTTVPQFGNDTLIPLLQQRHVTIDVESSNSDAVSFWVNLILFGILPIALLVGLFWWIGRRASAAQGGLFSFGQSRPRLYLANGTARTTFDDVAGVDEAKAELVEIVNYLKAPERYQRLGGRVPKGVLLVGPPGTGKTLLAKAVAGEADVPFLSMTGSEFVEMLVGVGASRVRDLFEKAKKSAPCIIFIDELDAVGRERGAGWGGGNDEREQTLNQILAEMDGFDPRQAIIVLAATNRPDVLDPALLRPGRFDRQIVVDRPEKEGRKAILQVHAHKLPLAADVNLDLLARSTAGMVGADLANLVNEAALAAARRNLTQVSQACFEEALDRLMMGLHRPLVMSPEERRMVAFHESGHALVAMLTPGADPVHKVTIVPHGRALGVTQMVPVDERHSYPRSYLLARLAVGLGGRAAEETIIGEITTGAEDDLQAVTKLAHEMVTRWGMSSRIGAMFLGAEQEVFLGRELGVGQRQGYSERTASAIDAEVQQLIQERYVHVQHLLSAHRDQLERLGQALLEHESLEEEQLRAVVFGAPDADANIPATMAPMTTVTPASETSPGSTA